MQARQALPADARHIEQQMFLSIHEATNERMQAEQLAKQGRHQEALKLRRSALHVLSSIENGDKYDVDSLRVQACMDVHDSLKKVADYDGAEEVLQSARLMATDLAATAVGPNQQLQAGLAMTIAGLRAEAVPLLRKSLDAYRSQLGDTHSSTVQAKKALAGTLHWLGETEEARDLKWQVLEYYKNNPCRAEDLQAAQESYDSIMHLIEIQGGQQ
jgi:tetratricopeptide (TPR) repeat protein